MGTDNDKLDSMSINAIRFLSLDAIQKAESGHPGLPLGAATMAYVLWTRFIHHNPSNPRWFNRDRFILSAGHGSMLIYSLLYLTGYDLPMSQIKQFRQWGSNTPGHPERGKTPGIEITTGPLGQGFGNGVGMAIAEAYLAAKFNRPGFEIINHYTYVLISDGDLMEGVSSEVASIAGHLKLGKLIYLYDNNHITLSSSTQLTFTEDIEKRFSSYGWHTVFVNDGNDIDAIDNALNVSKTERDRPSLIIVRTHIGYGSPHKQDSFHAHGTPFGNEEVNLTKTNLGWPQKPPFYVPDEALKHFRKAVDHGMETEKVWNAAYKDYEKEYPLPARELLGFINNELPDGWDADIPSFPGDPYGMATRDASGKIMQVLSKKLSNLIGGSADLNVSTFTEIKNCGNFEHVTTAEGDLQGAIDGGWSYAGRNLHFGIREHGMAAILTRTLHEWNS